MDLSRNDATKTNLFKGGNFSTAASSTTFFKEVALHHINILPACAQRTK